MLRSLSSVLLAAFFLAAGLFGMRWVRDNAPEPAAVPPRDPGPVEVVAVPLVALDVPVTVRGFGSLAPLRTARIASEIGGTLERVHAGWRDGAWVEEGVELCAVDTRELDAERARLAALERQAVAELESARAALRLAEASRALAGEVLAAREREEQRWRGLLEAGHGEEARVDGALTARIAAAQGVADAEAATSTARAAVATAEARGAEVAAGLSLVETRLAKAVVRAPFAGRLVGAAPAVGHHVVLGAPLVELVDTSVLRLVLHVPEDEVLGVRVGQPAQVELFDGRGTRLAAEVAAVGARADARTRSVPVEVDLPNARGAAPAAVLPAGLFAAAEVQVEELRGALVIDRAHVVWRGGVPLAFVLRDGPDGQLAEARPLTLGRALDERHEVRAGLRAGERLITSSLRFLGDGSAVRAVAPPPERALDGDLER